MASAVFKGNRERIRSLDIDAPLANATIRCCEYYDSPYRVATEQAEANGDSDGAAIFRLLHELVSFSIVADNPQQPFVPRFQGAGSRSFIPADLSPEDLPVVRDLAVLTNDPALRSRLLDIVWELTKDHTACAEAATLYVAAAERLNADGRWVYAEPLYRRGLDLAAKLGRSKDLFKQLCETLQRSTRLAAPDPGFRCCHYLKILVDLGCADVAEFATIAAATAQAAAEEGNPRRARAYWEVEAQLHRLRRNEPEARRAQFAAAETYIVEARNSAKGPAGSAMAAASILVNGVEALRRAGASRDRIEEVRKELGEYQARSVAEMKPFTIQLPDISQLVQAAQEHVRNANLPDAIKRFALGYPLLNPEDIRKSVIRAARQAPLSHSVTAILLDCKGRVTAKRGGLLRGSNEAEEQRLEALGGRPKPASCGHLKTGQSE